MYLPKAKQKFVIEEVDYKDSKKYKEEDYIYKSLCQSAFGLKVVLRPESSPHLHTNGILVFHR